MGARPGGGWTGILLGGGSLTIIKWGRLVSNLKDGGG